MQYPASKIVTYSTHVIRFLDGTEQRYPDSKGPLHRWIIKLDMLDETELTVLENFFLTEQGSFGSFAFVDPWDETEYPDCSLEDDIFEWELVGDMRGKAELSVKENKK